MEEYDDVPSIRSERELVEEILNTYKDLPCLWDVSHELYKNKQARHNALEISLNMWRNIVKKITLESVKKKLENMRTTFLREHKKVEASKTTGAAAAEIYKPSLWYYENMMFLIENHTAKREGVDSIETEETSNVEASKTTGAAAAEIYKPSLWYYENMMFLIENHTAKREGVEEKNESVKRSKRNKQIDIQSKQLKLLDSAEKMLCEEDTTESIAKAIALQLKDMSKLQRIIAEKIISEIMFCGKIDQLTVNSSINLNCIASSQSPSQSPVNKNNLQTRRHIYMPISPASEYRYTCTPSPSQSPASHIYQHTAYIENNNDLCNSVVLLSNPEIDCQVLPTETQMSFTQQSSDLLIGNQSISTPQLTTPHHTPQANIIYEGDGNLLKDFLILPKKP